jgi:hypothetical protein
MTFVALVSICLTIFSVGWTISAIKSRMLWGSLLGFGLLALVICIDVVVARVVIGNPSSLLKAPCGRFESKYGGIRDIPCDKSGK